MWTMSEQHSVANPIDARAIEWVTQIDKGEMPASRRAELDAWLEADSRHRGAFLRAQAAWKVLDRLNILPHEDLDVPPSRQVRLSRRGALIGGGAAIVGAAAAVGIFRNGQDQIRTAIGEIRRVPLDDGSVAAINTDSELNVAFKPDLREITLAKGEAWFDVAKDRRRPFVVAAGDVRVRAVGTAFSVRRRDSGADVLVTEGVVETWMVGAEGRGKRIAAGAKIFVSDLAGPSKLVVGHSGIDRTLAWRSGEIALNGETLGDAATEFNRYNTRRVTVDPSFLERRLVGWFHTNDPETFARAAAATLGANVVAGNDEIHIAPKSQR